MKIAIFGQFYQKNSEAAVETLLECLIKKDTDLYIDVDFHNLINTKLNIFPMVKEMVPNT